VPARGPYFFSSEINGKTIDDVLSEIPQNLATVVATKRSWWVFLLEPRFQLVFDLKHLENIIGTLLNKSITSKNKINRITTQNQLENNSWARISFFVHFQRPKTPNLNLSYHMEPFGRKINHFGGWNYWTNNFLFLEWNPTSLSLLISKKDWKIINIKFGSEIKFFEIKGTNQLID